MRQAILLSIIIFIGQTLWAQNTIGIPQIINYDKNDFRAGSQTWDIDQDADGRMYFANNEGLVTFDGSYWKLHPLPNKTIVRSVAIEEKGTIYVGGQGEIGYFTPDKKGNLLYTSLIPLLPTEQQTLADVWDIELLEESVFFRASDRTILELKNNHFSVYPAKSAWKFLQKSNGRIYAQDMLEGLYTFNNDKWVPVKNNKFIKGSLISVLMESGRDSILVLSNDFQAFTLINDSLIANNEFNKLNNKINIYKSTKINNNEFAISTRSEGVLVMNKSGRVIQRISRHEGLQNNNVISVFFDKDGNLWAGLNNGISFIAYNSAIKFIRPNGADDVAGFTSTVYENQLFIGSSDGAYKVNISNESKDLGFSKGIFTRISNSAGQVWKIDEVNGKILMAHNNGCYNIINSTANQISQDAGWLFVPMSKIIPSSNILVGTYSGLKMLSYSNNTFKDQGNLEGTYESLRFITIENDGRIWASHPYRGIYLIAIGADQKRYSAELFTEKEGLPSIMDNHVYKIKNRIVFTTRKGVYEFDAKTRRFIKSAFLNNILGDIEVRYLTEDKDGNIWFCSGKKIGVINYNKNKQQPHITYLPELNGLVLSGFENVYPYDQQNIFIASEKGVVLVNYQKYKSNKTKPVIILGNIKASGKNDTAIFGGYSLTDSLIRKPLRGQRPVTLSSNFNSFHFEYSSPAYGMQKNIEYAYILDGYDKKWSSWSSKSEKDYTNLPFGEYIFKAKAKDNLGNESNEVAYAFVITPPWYRNYLAYFIYLLTAGLAIYFIRQYQRKKLLNQKLMYEESQRQMSILHQLELEKNEKEIIQLRNENLESEILLKTKELADTSIQLVEKSDTLLKVKEELQKLYRNTNENHDIKKALHWLNDIEKNNASWENFASHFDEINNNFLKNLKANFPRLTNTDLKVCAYLQLNLSSKEISQLMNISVRGVEISRYRLRKKLNLNTEESISNFLEKYKAI